jgi:hypothetical protein
VAVSLTCDRALDEMTERLIDTGRKTSHDGVAQVKGGNMRRLFLGVLGAALVLFSGCALFESGILYEEKWSDPAQVDWTIGESELANKWIEGDRYHILVKQSSTLVYWNSTKGPFGNAQYDLDVQHVAGTNNLSGAGLLVRLADINNMYMFQISAGGTYRVGKWVANAWTNLVGWAESSSIRQGVAENHLTVIADGASFTFLVNGTEVAELTDASFSSGRVGVAITAFSNDVDVHESFDNLVVRELK